MSHSITIPGPDSSPTPITLSYSIELAENIQTINCSVTEKYSPAWLQLRKFNLLSRKEKNTYVPLFNEINSSRNMATSLFIDSAYVNIMHAEKMLISKSDN